MHKYTIIIILQLFFIVTSSFSQNHIIRGKVVDSESFSPLAFVNIIYNNQKLGTTTGIDGEFTINSDEQIRFIRLSYIGYETRIITIDPGNANAYLNIELIRRPVEIDEVVVYPGENPAHRIINKVILNRNINNPEKMSSFSYNSYNKMIFTVDMGKDSLFFESSENSDSSLFTEVNKFLQNQYLLLMESITYKEFMFPDKIKEDILASRVSGLKDPSFTVLATQFQSLSFYDDLIKVFDKNYLNPISRGSSKKYFFSLEDTLYSPSYDTIFVISYRPFKGKNFNGLEGILHINTNNYAIQSVMAQPFGDLSTTAKIQQKYEFIENKHWFPVQLNTDLIFKNFNAQFTSQDSSEVKKRIPVKFTKNIIASGKSYITNIQLSPQLDKKTFNNVSLSYNDDALNRKKEFWDNYRVYPLSKKDSLTYIVIDSIGKAEALDQKMKAIEMLTGGKIPLGIINIDYRKLLNYNSVEGFRIGLGIETSNKLTQRFNIKGYIARGFKDIKIKYGTSLDFILHKASGLHLSVYGSDDMKETGSYNFYNNKSIRSTEFYRPMLVEDMDEVRQIGVSLKISPASHFTGIISLNNNVKTSLSDYNYRQLDTKTFNFTELGLSFRYAYGEKFMKTIKGKFALGTLYPVVRINILKGLSIFDGDFNYYKFIANISKSFTTKSFGISNLNLTAGYLNQDVPLTNLFHGRGSYKNFTVETENSFGTMRFGEFYSDRFIYVFFKQDLGSLLFKSGRFQPKIALITNLGFGNLRNPENHKNIDFKTLEKGYFESGILLNNLIDFAGFIEYGVGVFYRYGPYSFSNNSKNFAFKFTIEIGL